MPREFLDDFRTIDLGDKRLNCRANTLLGTLSAMPSESINAACPNWSETDAAYKFFDNDRVSPDAIMDAIRAATEQRIDQHKVVLIVQDTTEIDFTGHPAADSGVLTQENSFGIYDHSHVAFTPEGLCLGVVGVEFFEREPGTLGEASKKKKSLPIEEKESYRWLKGSRLVTELNVSHPNTHIISVADRECDIHDIFAEQFANENAGDFIIRAAQNRRGTELDEEAGGRTYKKVRDEVANSEVRVVCEMQLPRTPKRAARDAKFHVRAKRVRVKPPHMRESLGEVEYNLILMEEVSCDPDDPTKVEWLLITTLPIDSPEEILQSVDYYVGRWAIEIFFKVYKSGCRVEEMQLGTTIRRKRALLFYNILAFSSKFPSPS